MHNDRGAFWDRISKKSLERLLAVGTTAVVLAGTCIYALGRPPENHFDMHMALNADGSSDVQFRMSWIWDGPAPAEELVLSRSPATVDDRWTDGEGRPLEAKAEPREGGGYNMHIRYASPVFPGDRVVVKESGKILEGAVQREGEEYVYKDKVNMGGGKPTALSYTVTLPAGAEVVSAQPDTKWRCVSNDREVLHFRWTEKPGHHPELRIKYSFPKAS